MSSTTQNPENPENPQVIDAFQDAFSELIDNYFEPEPKKEDENNKVPRETSPEPTPELTPEEEERLIMEWCENSLRQLILTWGHGAVQISDLEE